MPIEMRHLIILVPGLMGSVLEKEGQGQIWGLSGQALWQYLRTLGGSLQSLRVANDDWQVDDLGDGIQGTQIIQDLHSIPFLVEHAGYSVITRRIQEYFDVTLSNRWAPRDDANFYTFPYDWRRDCRASARQLKRFVDTRLPRWRAWSGAQDAQAILIGHSLGGLVARHYLEAMGGWRDCRAVITVGSPHRGAIGALDVVSNGFRKLFFDLSEVVRSFPSAYQILPTYPAVQVGAQYVRPGETDAIPNLDPARAREARDNFLDATRRAALANRGEPAYQQRTIPWVGTRQDTLHSAAIRAGKLEVSYGPPPGLDPSLADGDGTVARFSAIPPELEELRVQRFAVERHGWLTNNEMTLEPLLETIRQVAAPGAVDLYGEPEVLRPSIGLRLEPLYLSGEPVSLQAKLANADDQPQPLIVQAEPVGQPGPGAAQTVDASGTEARAIVFEALAPGLYQVTARAPTAGPRAPAAVHGVFEVADAAA
ncbi:MAG: lecithin--cholesterol acyltransferase [Anaerolineales bacterium]|nr:lecithin--cholesterol acyltransferase [Anaerolineales bacterium]